MEGNQTLIDWIRGKRWPVVAPLAGYPGIQLTHTSVKQNLFNWRAQFQTISALAETAQPDMVFPLMDLSVEVNALGALVRYPLDETPTVEEPLLRSAEDLRKIEPIDILADGRVHVFLETVRHLKASLRIPVCGYVVGPFTLTGLLLGASQAAMATITEPEFLQTVVGFAQKVILHYATALTKVGADAVAILEPTAALLSPEAFDKFSAPYVEAIVRELPVPCILHVCGDATRLLRSMAETGAQGLSLDYHVDLAEAVREVPENVVLIGNLDPAGVISRGSAEEVREASRRLLEKMKGCDNFIFSTGCDLPPETPVANIQAMVETARSFAA